MNERRNKLPAMEESLIEREEAMERDTATTDQVQRVRDSESSAEARSRVVSK